MPGPARRIIPSRSRASFLAAAAVALGACVVAPADATSAGDLNAQANSIAASIASDNAALHENSLSYLEERASYLSDLDNEHATEASITTIGDEVSADRQVVRDDAIAAYVAADSSGPIALYLHGGLAQAATFNAYASAVADHLDTSVTQLEDDEALLSKTLVVERSDVAAAAHAAAITTAARFSVLSTVSSERSLLHGVNAHIQALVRAENLRAERAAAAARATAEPVAPVGAYTTAADPTSTSTLAGGFAAIRNCESGGDYSLDTGNGYYGAYQFSASTWWGLGGTGTANSAPAAAQDAAALRLYQSSGWSAWPECAAIAGL